MSNYEIVLRDVLGRQVYSWQSERQELNVDRELNVSGLPKGVYLLQINTTQAQKTLKLIKE
jgi:hypothetical protein